MIIYIDVLIIINYMFDFIILFIVNKVLKRNIKVKRIILSAIFGEISLLLLIFNINYYLLFVIKILLAIIINVICFKYNNIKYLLVNVSYFYMISIILGGFILMLKLNKINYIIAIMLSPIIMFIYYFQEKRIKNKVDNYYEVVINFDNNHRIITMGYLDTGNNLIDPISKRIVIIVNKRLIKLKIKNKIYVPCKVLNNVSLIKCIKPKNIIFNNKVYTNVLIGISNDELNLDGIDCLLNNRLMEG